MSKAALLEALRAGRARWEAALAQCDRAHLTEPGVVGEWSVKDLIDHVTWFEREMVGVLQARALVGSELWQLPVDERNAAIFERNRQRLLPEVLAEAAEVHRELVDAIEALADEDLNDARRFREMPGDWQPWRIIAENSYAHYDDHLGALREWQGNRIRKG